MGLALIAASLKARHTRNLLYSQESCPSKSAYSSFVSIELHTKTVGVPKRKLGLVRHAMARPAKEVGRWIVQKIGDPIGVQTRIAFHLLAETR